MKTLLDLSLELSDEVGTILANIFVVTATNTRTLPILAVVPLRFPI